MGFVTLNVAESLKVEDLLLTLSVLLGTVMKFFGGAGSRDFEVFGRFFWDMTAGVSSSELLSL